ncbi:hypothetical protein PR003_g14673 [Phytophthora rubi]|uniref:Uncharacterized protein n=1 Tax=Phytophthora rubi TaxID=129364 RepID=A0A6A3LTM0_9STRA|nr:hypothetical protein PR002_g12203 [Phytophthora rubi]KAE9027877.1 hypothetical protein PR001_g11866 [Phytophthora rubi]KAE9332113.1 hypothetical protein PR003_g14673 [Phytophthora rubi]
MMDSTSESTISAPVNADGEPSSPFLVGSVAPSTATTAPPNRSLSSSRPHRSRRGFAAGKLRLSLRIDADCTANGKTSSVTGQSTPASTSSSCSSSDVVPWWEVEYQCPPPGHLGAHVVPVSADEQAEQQTGSSITSERPTNSTTRSAESSVTDLSTPTETHTTSTPQQTSAMRPGLVVYETPERARRGPRNKLSAIRASVPCLLVDSSPSQKRKMRSQDPTDSEADLFPTHVAKELKRFHESSCGSLKKSSLPSRVVTPSTLVQPLTQIGISQTPRLKPRTLTTDTAAPQER